MARYRWIVAVGLLIIAVVALRMIYEGGAEIWTAIRYDWPISASHSCFGQRS